MTRVAHHEGGVRRRRQVVAVAEHRADVAHVELASTVSVPFQPTRRAGAGRRPGQLASRWITRTSYSPQVLVPARASPRLGRRHLHHRGIEQRVLAEHAAIGEVDLAEGLDHEERVGAGRREAVGGAARDEQVVARLVRQRPEVGLEAPGAAVDEQQLVGVGVAEQVRHRGVAVSVARIKGTSAFSSTPWRAAR
jgi:hypothetical protein